MLAAHTRTRLSSECTKAARMPSGTVSREPYQTGFCQESTVTVDNLLSPSWDFQKDVDEAAGPQTEVLDGTRKVAALSGLSHYCWMLHHEAL